MNTYSEENSHSVDSKIIGKAKRYHYRVYYIQSVPVGVTVYLVAYTSSYFLYGSQKKFNLNNFKIEQIYHTLNQSYMTKLYQDNDKMFIAHMNTMLA